MKKELINSKEEWLAIKNEPRGYWKEIFKDNYRAVEDSDDPEPWPEPDPLSYPCIVIYEEVLARIAYGEPYYEWHWRFVYPEDFMPKCQKCGGTRFYRGGTALIDGKFHHFFECEACGENRIEEIREWKTEHDTSGHRQRIGS